MKNLSRNAPIALVVGVAGFIGSNLAEKLVSKNIQVIGVDDFSKGSKENLEEVIKENKFHFFNQSIADFIPNFERLDYAYFLVNPDKYPLQYKEELRSFLKVCEKYESIKRASSCRNNEPKVLLVSSIELYDQDAAGFENLKQAEEELAKLAKDKSLNVRVVRLANVFGPRMRFENSDPVHRLIKDAIKNEIQNTSTPLDFTTRSLFIDDAVNLLIKAMLHGGTAHKIFDGAARFPIKISEIKQILIDPLWHEARNFQPTPLPPWSSPNLEKTEKELSWHPQVSIIKGLKLTLAFFKDRPEVLAEKTVIEKKNSFWEREETDQPPEVSLAKGGSSDNSGESLEKEKIQEKISWLIGKLVLIFGFCLIIYVLVIPLIKIIFETTNLTKYISKANQKVYDRQYSDALGSLNLAKGGVKTVEKLLSPIILLNNLGIKFKEGESVIKIVKAYEKVVDGTRNYTLGIENLNFGLKGLAGEVIKDKEANWQEAKVNLKAAGESFSFSEASLTWLNQKGDFPPQFNRWLENYLDKVKLERIKIEGTYFTTQILSKIASSKGEKNYLIVLLDNNNLKPTGGKPVAFLEVNLKDGQVVSFKNYSTEQLDQKLTEELEPDFPSTARLIEWFFQKQTGKQIEGVVVLDLTTLERIDGIFDARSLRENTLNPEGEKQLTSVFGEIIKRVIYLPKINLIEIGDILSLSAKEKHLMIYLNDDELLSLIAEKGYAGFMPRQVLAQKGESNQFLSLIESNLSDNPNNYFLKKDILFKTNISSEGKINHNLEVIFKNQNPSLDLLTAGYRFRLKIYLSSGSKITKATFGSQDITNSLTSFSDYGRAGYTTILQLSPKTEKKLSLEILNSEIIREDSGNFKYHLDVVKQPGIENDKFEHRINYPSNWKVVSDVKSNNPGLITFSTDLSTDRSFEVVFDNK